MPHYVADGDSALEFSSARAAASFVKRSLTLTYHCGEHFLRTTAHTRTEIDEEQARLEQTCSESWRTKSWA